MRNTRVVKDISDFIFIEDTPQKADVIFIPGGAYPELPELAARLWQERYADYVVPSGAYAITEGKFAGVKSKRDLYTDDYETECDFYCDVLRRGGVPGQAVIREDKSQFTAQNAWFSKEILQERGIMPKKAIICCKAFHARRCLMYYQFAFPETEFLVVPAKDTHDGQITKENWYLSESGAKRVLGELNRIGSQFVPEFTALRNTNADIEQ